MQHLKSTESGQWVSKDLEGKLVADINHGALDSLIIPSPFLQL